ncbi:MAG TPA: hypothetical protein VMD05_09025 [Candidatus Nanoarchaeia archaeon]|nr:hypothetical protein [Candidatus Nanoarchaeia archaeon]
MQKTGGLHAVASEMASKPDDFNLLLIDSIDEALLSLGESARRSIYFHIEKNFKVERKEIPGDLEHFQLALEKIFGVGARYIEILIMRNLYQKMGRSFKLRKNDQLEFIKYVEAAKQGFNAECSCSHDC